MKPKIAELARSLSDVEQQFVELWGDMSSWWGVSRTMAEIHGLLYISGAALSAEEIQERLGISRGNVSMNIRTLVEWGLVRRIRRRGDRRDYFESLTDVWEMFTLLAEQRKRREIDPVIRTLEQCKNRLASEAKDNPPHAAQAREYRRRVEELFGFLSMMENIAERFFKGPGDLKAAVQLLGRK